MFPEQFPRRILLCLTGLSPQVVTETLYALATKNAPFIPTEIHLFTTLEGIERARLTLLSYEPGWFRRLSSELSLPEIEFSEENIHVPRDEQGNIVTDLRTEADNERAADDLSTLISQFTADDEAALHVSISGGRKSMGFYAGYAISLYGREQDRLSHVLVSEGFEGHHGFFYPTKERNVIYSLDDKNKPMDTSTAKVTLADIPFVRMRDGLPERLLEGRVTFSETVRAARLSEEEPFLTLNVESRSVEIADERFEMSPAEFAFYFWFAQMRKERRDPVRWTDDDLAEDYLAHFRSHVSEMDSTLEGAESALSSGMDQGWFDPQKSRVNKRLRGALGIPLSRKYLITGSGPRGLTRYGLTGLSPNQITVNS